MLIFAPSQLTSESYAGKCKTQKFQRWWRFIQLCADPISRMSCIFCGISFSVLFKFANVWLRLTVVSVLDYFTIYISTAQLSAPPQSSLDFIQYFNLYAIVDSWRMIGDEASKIEWTFFWLIHLIYVLNMAESNFLLHPHSSSSVVHIHLRASTHVFRLCFLCVLDDSLRLHKHWGCRQHQIAITVSPCGVLMTHINSIFSHHNDEMRSVTLRSINSLFDSMLSPSPMSSERDHPLPITNRH